MNKINRLAAKDRIIERCGNRVLSWSRATWNAFVYAEMRLQAQKKDVFGTTRPKE